MKIAKDEYKSTFFAETRKPFSPASLDRAILANTKIKIAMDELIEALRKAQTAKCFGKDADAWARAIPQLQAESDEIGRTREEWLQMQAEMRRIERGHSR